MMKPIVYFFRRSDGAIKIGYTASSVRGRMKSLERIYGKIELLGVVDGNFGAERALHKRLSGING